MTMRIFGFLAFALLVGCSEMPPLAGADPKTLPPEGIPKMMARLSSSAHLSVSGVGFIDERLFVTTNIGLIEVYGRTVRGLHTWYEKFNVVSGPWPDAPRAALWIHRADDGYFVRHDKNGWQRIALPEPPKGYYSNGDFLRGFVGIGDAEHFYLVGAGAVWRWTSAGEWVLEPLPPAEDPSSVVAFGRIGAREVHVVRKRACEFSPCDHVVYWREDGQWRNPIPIRIDRTKWIVSTREGVFIRGDKGELLRLDLDAAVPMKTPGPCEAITLTSSGNLLASFRGTGIYILSDSNWKKLLDDPYTAAEGEHWAYLAESNGVIAFGTASVPHLKDGKRTRTGTDALWVSEDERLVRVNLAPGRDGME